MIIKNVGYALISGYERTKTNISKRSKFPCLLRLAHVVSMKNALSIQINFVLIFQQCNTVTEQECSQVFDEQCSDVQEEECETVNEQECSQTFETECSTEEKEQCYTKYEEKCETVYKVGSLRNIHLARFIAK